MPNRRTLRLVTALLLAWVAFDLAAIDTCALDIGGGRGSRQTSVSAPDLRGALAHHHAAPHPDHCFCHGLSTGADTTAALMSPFFTSGGMPGTPPGRVLNVSSALYHPPQLTA